MLVPKSHSLYVIMVPGCESRDAGIVGVPKRGWKALPVSEKVKVLDLVRHFTILHHYKGKYGTIRHTERGNIHIPFITVYCYNCFTL